ncbi:ribonuclease P protein component [Methylobacterium sp. sgz302541]|uniref:ribonuclease P protein component n=1 Tax=unclassified Methylobacterium TaxID=2615210 RepID=UPI003D33D8A4
MSTIERLRRRSEFLAVTDGRRFHTERMTVQGQLRPVSDETAPAGLRIGFTITKRVGHATERNRIRRRLRAAVSAVAPGAPTTVPADVVLVARRPALSVDFETLKGDLARALSIVTRPQDPNRKPSSRRGGKPRKAGERTASPGLAPGAPLPNPCDGSPDGQ